MGIDDSASIAPMITKEFKRVQLNNLKTKYSKTRSLNWAALIKPYLSKLQGVPRKLFKSEAFL